MAKVVFKQTPQAPEAAPALHSAECSDFPARPKSIEGSDLIGPASAYRRYLISEAYIFSKAVLGASQP